MPALLYDWLYVSNFVLRCLVDVARNDRTSVETQRSSFHLQSTSSISSKNFQGRGIVFRYFFCSSQCNFNWNSFCLICTLLMLLIASYFQSQLMLLYFSHHTVLHRYIIAVHQAVTIIRQTVTENHSFR